MDTANSSFSRQRYLLNRRNNPAHRFVSGKFLQNSHHALLKNLSISEWLVMLGEYPGSLQRHTCCPLLFSWGSVNNSAGMGILRFQSSNLSLTGLWLFRIWLLEASMLCLVVTPQIVFFRDSDSFVAKETQGGIAFLEVGTMNTYLSVHSSLKLRFSAWTFLLKALRERHFSFNYISSFSVLHKLRPAFWQWWTAWQPQKYEA